MLTRINTRKKQTLELKREAEVSVVLNVPRSMRAQKSPSRVLVSMSLLSPGRTSFSICATPLHQPHFLLHLCHCATAAYGTPQRASKFTNTQRHGTLAKEKNTSLRLAKPLRRSTQPWPNERNTSFGLQNTGFCRVNISETEAFEGGSAENCVYARTKLWLFNKYKSTAVDQ